MCISATTFGDPSTKEVALKIGSDLARQITPLYLDASPQCCSMKVQLLLAGPGFTINVLFTLPNPNNRANAQKAEHLLLLSQESIERDELSNASTSLQQWAPRHAAQPSVLESIMSSRINLMKAKILRYQGKFQDSRQYLEPLVHQHPALRSQFRSRMHLITVYSELGSWEKARATLESTIAQTEQQQRMLQLTKAEYHLARALSSEVDNNDSIAARDIFTSLSHQYMAIELRSQARRRNYFRVCAGLAMSQHMQLRHHLAGSFRTLSEWMVAIWSCWEPLTAGPHGGFPRLICLLSMAEIKCHSPNIPDQDSPDLDLLKAREIWSRLVRQESSQRFIFTNLGTRWAAAACR